MWDTGSNSDRADLHVAVAYPPAFLMGVGIAASQSQPRDLDYFFEFMATVRMSFLLGGE